MAYAIRVGDKKVKKIADVTMNSIGDIVIYETLSMVEKIILVYTSDGDGVSGPTFETYVDVFVDDTVNGNWMADKSVSLANGLDRVVFNVDYVHRFKVVLSGMGSATFYKIRVWVVER